MTAVAGLVGFRPAPQRCHEVVAPPYDVIKPGSRLEALCASRPHCLTQVTLGEDPRAALQRLLSAGVLIPDNEPAHHVTEQTWAGGRRLGVFSAVEVSDYAAGQVIRHEKVFDDKVQGRMRLAEATGLSMEPIFLLTRAAIGNVLETVVASRPADEDLTPDFQGLNDLHAVRTRVWRVAAESATGQELARLVGQHPLYIADGHHRYHTAVRLGLTHCMAYLTADAAIQAYNRVINPRIPWETARQHLDLIPCDGLHTPPAQHFCIHSREGSWLLKARQVPTDVVGRLDCSILERELYPALGLTHDHIIDPAYFDYYPASQLDQMAEQVAGGRYRLAVALHPVSRDQLIAVADAGLGDPRIVMPEKSTFFAPKVLSGLMIHKHAKRA
jgi:uncharacterized protein (DUF1015 family)